MKSYDEEQLRDHLSRYVAALGSQKKFAEAAGISEQYLSDILRGLRAVPDRVLDALNFERVVIYRRRVG